MDIHVSASPALSTSKELYTHLFCVDSGDQSQVLRLARQALNQVSHLPSPLGNERCAHLQNLASSFTSFSTVEEDTSGALSRRAIEIPGAV